MANRQQKRERKKKKSIEKQALSKEKKGIYFPIQNLLKI